MIPSELLTTTRWIAIVLTLAGRTLEAVGLILTEYEHVASPGDTFVRF